MRSDDHAGRERLGVRRERIAIVGELQRRSRAAATAQNAENGTSRCAGHGIATGPARDLERARDAPPSGAASVCLLVVPAGTSRRSSAVALRANHARLDLAAVPRELLPDGHCRRGSATRPDRARRYARRLAGGSNATVARAVGPQQVLPWCERTVARVERGRRRGRARSPQPCGRPEAPTAAPEQPAILLRRVQRRREHAQRLRKKDGRAPTDAVVRSAHQLPCCRVDRLRHTVAHRGDRLVGEDRAQVVVRREADVLPRHRRKQRTALHLVTAVADRLDERPGVHRPSPVSRSGVRFAVKLTPHPGPAVIVFETMPIHGPSVARGALVITCDAGCPDSMRLMSRALTVRTILRRWQPLQPMMVTR